MTAVLEVRDLTVRFRNGKRLTSLVEGVSFTVRRGGCLGILGESGSGKSMSCKAVLGLLDDNFQVEGSALFEGRQLLGEHPEVLRRLRGGRIGVVLQNPMSCLIRSTASGNRWPRRWPSILVSAVEPCGKRWWIS